MARNQQASMDLGFGIRLIQQGVQQYLKGADMKGIRPKAQPIPTWSQKREGSVQNTTHTQNPLLYSPNPKNRRCKNPLRRAGAHRSGGGGGASQPPQIAYSQCLQLSSSNPTMNQINPNETAQLEIHSKRSPRKSA